MTEAEYSDRQHMVNEIKKMLPDTSELSVESDGFFLSEEHKKLISEIGAANPIRALLSRLWTGFFDTARCRYTEKFSKPRFQPKMA